MRLHGPRKFCNGKAGFKRDVEERRGMLHRHAWAGTPQYIQNPGQLGNPKSIYFVHFANPPVIINTDRMN